MSDILNPRQEWVVETWVAALEAMIELLDHVEASGCDGDLLELPRAKLMWEMLYA